MSSKTTEPPPSSSWQPSPLWISITVGLLTVAAIGLWLSIPVYRQRSATKTILRLDGRIFETRQTGPAWLRQRLSENRAELFTELVEISLADTAADDATLGQLSGLSSVTWLILRGTRVTDHGMPLMKGLTNLETLSLSSTRVTDAGLVHVKTLPHLRMLFLTSTDVTDAGLEHLKELSTLEDVWLEHTHVTDAGAAKLQLALPKLAIHK